MKQGPEGRRDVLVDCIRSGLGSGKTPEAIAETIMSYFKLEPNVRIEPMADFPQVSADGVLPLRIIHEGRDNPFRITGVVVQDGTYTVTVSK